MLDTIGDDAVDILESTYCLPGCKLFEDAGVMKVIFKFRHTVALAGNQGNNRASQLGFECFYIDLDPLLGCDINHVHRNHTGNAQSL